MYLHPLVKIHPHHCQIDYWGLEKALLFKKSTILQMWLLVVPEAQYCLMSQLMGIIPLQIIQPPVHHLFINILHHQNRYARWDLTDFFTSSKDLCKNRKNTEKKLFKWEFCYFKCFEILSWLKSWQNKKGPTFVVMLGFCMSFFCCRQLTQIKKKVM